MREAVSTVQVRNRVMEETTPLVKCRRTVAAASLPQVRVGVVMVCRVAMNTPMDDAYIPKPAPFHMAP